MALLMFHGPSRPSAPLLSERCAQVQTLRLRRALRITTLVALLAGGLGAAYAQTSTTSPATAAGPIERIKLTDNELGCAQIHAEVGQMDKIMADAKAAEDKEKTTGTAAGAANTVADVAGKLGVFGRIGGLGGALFGQAAAQAGAGALQKSAQESAQQMAERSKQAGARKEHLTALFLAKECKASDLSASGKALSGAEVQKIAAATAPAPSPAQAAATPVPAQPAEIAKWLEAGAASARGASLPAAPLVAAGGANVKAVVGRTNKVVIAGYRVAFVGRTGVAASSTGSRSVSYGVFGSKTTTYTAGQSKSLDVALRNVNADMMQALTDHLYGDFVEQLKASGLEVLPREALARSPHFAQVEPFKPKSAGPYTVKQFSDPREYTVMTPTGLPMIFLAAEQFGDRGLIDLGQMKGIMFSAMDAGAAALMVQVVIDFAETSSSGHSRWVNMAEVDARPSISLAPARSSYITALHSTNTIMGEWGTMAVDKPVPVGSDFATVKVVDDPNNITELSKSLFRASVALGGGAGARVSYQELRLFDADPARYGDLALQAGMTANRAFVAAAK